MYKFPTIQELVLAICVVPALFFVSFALGEGNCPTTGSVTVITAGTQGNVIIVQSCSGGGNCPVTPSVTLVAVGSGCPFQFQAIINNPQINTVYTTTLFVRTTPLGPRVTVETQTVGPFTTIPAGGVSATFSNLPASGGWFEVDVSVPGFPIVTSSKSHIPVCPSGECPTPTLTRLSGDLCAQNLVLSSTITACTTGVSYTFTLQSSSAAGGPFTNTGQSLTVVCNSGVASAIFSGISQAAFYRIQLSSTACATTFSPVLNVPQQTSLPTGSSITLTLNQQICQAIGQAATLTCNIVPPNTIVGTVVYQFFIQGSTTPIPPTSGNTLVLNLNSQGNVNYFCTASVDNSCVITSNPVFVGICPGTCPTPTLTGGEGSLCAGNLQLQSSISGCTNGVSYTFTLQQGPAEAGPFSNVANPAPIAVVCVGGLASVTFVDVNQGGFYRVQLTSTACTTAFSTVLDVPQQTSLPTGSSLLISVDQVICEPLNQVATLTCDLIPADAIAGTVTYQFFVQGSTTPIPPTSGNTLVLTMSSQGNVNYLCTASNGSSCVITSGNVVLASVCNP